MNTIKECKDRCDAHNDCLSFSYAPPNAKDHAKVCTLYDKAEPTQTRLRMSWSSAPGRTINSRLAVHTAKSGGGWATRLMESPILMHAQLQQLRTNTAAGSTFTFMTTAVGAAAISNVRLIFVPRQGRQGRLLPTACTACSNPWDSMAKGTALRGTRSSRRPGSLPEALSVSKASTPTCLPRGRRKPGRCAERRIRRPSSSAFGRMRVTDATVHSACTPSGHSNVQTWKLV